LGLLLPYISGLIFGRYIEIPGRFLLPFILVSVILLLVICKQRFKPFLLYLSLIILFFTGLFLMRVSLNPVLPANHLRNLVDGRTWDIEGVPYKSPEMLTDRMRVYIEVSEAARDGKVKSVTGMMLLTIGDHSAELKYGDRIRVRTKPVLPRNFGNPGGFDYERFLLSRGIMVKGYVKSGRGVAKIYNVPDGKEDSFLSGFANFQGIVEKIRSRMRDFLDNTVAAPERGLLKALLLGEKGEIEKETKEAFIKSGTAHILAISGLHIGIIAFVSFWIIFKLLSFSTSSYGIFTLPIKTCFLPKP